MYRKKQQKQKIADWMSVFIRNNEKKYTTSFNLLSSF